MISAHYGNFELGGYLMGLFGFPTYTVARELDNRYLDRFVNDFRGRTGQYMLPKRAAARRSSRCSTSGGILTLLGDQSAGKKGCWVKFFGRPASTHKAVSLFSLGNEAPTMVSYARRIGRAAALRSRAGGDRRSARARLRAGHHAALGAMVHRPSWRI